MKKISLFLLTFVLLGAGCASSQTAFVPVDVDHEPTVDGEVFVLDGGFSLKFINEHTSTDHANKVCVELAQFATINNGDGFCLLNTEESLDMLGLDVEDIDTSCEYYWGIVSAEVELFDEKPSQLKSDCAATESGLCQPEYATLLNIIEMEDEVRCN